MVTGYNQGKFAEIRNSGKVQTLVFLETIKLYYHQIRQCVVGILKVVHQAHSPFLGDWPPGRHSSHVYTMRLHQSQ